MLDLPLLISLWIHSPEYDPLLVCESLNLGVVLGSPNTVIFLLKLVFPPLSKEMSQTHQSASQKCEPFWNSLLQSHVH